MALNIVKRLVRAVTGTQETPVAPAPELSLYDSMRAKLDALVAQRDAVNAQIAPIQVSLDAANTKVSEAQAVALDLAAQIQALRGGQPWLDLKRDIALLSKALSGK